MGLFQLLGYVVRISEREREINAGERKARRVENINNGFPENDGIKKECISVVLPVIIYHGEKEWNVDDNLSALYCNPDSFSHYIPEFNYELVDFSTLKNHQIQGNVHLQVTILLMNHYYSDQFDDIFEQALISLVNEVDDWSTIQFIAVITLYSSSHKSRGQQWIQSTIEKTYPKIFGEKGGLIMEGVSNIWIDQGLEKGRNCMKNMLIDALKIKFNNVSQPIGNFIQSIKDEEMLQRLHREILLCNNMYEFQHRLESIRVS
ncbi:MAG: transposase YhgA family protein [Candidatus Magnetoglobus multicellularis str. Araruama]|uniref:Transposase YhgA family protein n=1 Tax=Candidatus Magnetoglobus multicellularis str. Araruama TaxID=890399 RepID=A0A1V1NTI8_9BACT|nr:MAG: transposase YhgA family protein [Candidatus Magnetoglobus multicellularis str. Araruama]